MGGTLLLIIHIASCTYRWCFICETAFNVVLWIRYESFRNERAFRNLFLVWVFRNSVPQINELWTASSHRMSIIPMGKKPLNTMRLAIISKKGENFHLFDANPKHNAIKLISIIEFRIADIATLKRKMLFASLSKRLVGDMCVWVVMLFRNLTFSLRVHLLYIRLSSLRWQWQ